MRHVMSALLAAVVLAACQPAVGTSVPDESAGSDVLIDQEAPTTIPVPGETQIVIDGQVDDWAGRPLVVDDGVDAEGDFLDITQVYAFLNQDALYLRLDFADPAAPLEQFDVEFQADGRWYILSYQPGSSQAYIDQLGPTTTSTFSYDSSLEMRLDRADLGDPAEIEIREIRVMVGECCQPPAWRAADTVGGIDLPVVHEVSAVAIAEGPAETRESRPGHVALPDGTPADYVYRSFVQIPVGMTRGPDGLIYIADWAGRHVVRVEPDGSTTDLGIWRVNPDIWQHDGPRDLAFDSTGTLYVNDHGQVYRIGADGVAEALPDVRGAPLGGIAIGPDDALYYTDRDAMNGSLRRWTAEDGSSLVAADIPWAEDVVVGLDGTLYVSQMAQDRVVKVDAATGEVAEFVSGGLGEGDPIYMTVDSEGDIWVRGISHLRQFAPDGSEKPYTIDGSPPSFNWHTSAGLAFDGEGSLWVAAYSSFVVRLDPTGASPDDFSLSRPIPGWESSDLAVGPSGELIAANDVTGEVWRFDPGGEGEVLTEFEGAQGRIAVAVDGDGTVFLGLPWNGIVYLDENNEPVPYADVLTRRMVFGSDGLLYAVAIDRGSDQPEAIVRISGPGQVETLTTTLAGNPLSGEIHLSPAPDGGLYTFGEQTRSLCTLSSDGQSEEILNLQPYGGGGPAVMAASPTGEIFVIPHGPYAVLRITPDGGHVEEYVQGVYGDPWGMAVSLDGVWLYVAESGVIDAIPISP